MDSGEIIVSFSLGKNVLLETAEKRFADIEMDARIGAIRISASLHKATIILYDNGKGVVLGQTSRKVSEMAVRHWADKLDNEEALT
jgi:TATA-box binding protein (TBP) (component of TFIID and TFIIIB)